MFNMTNNDNGQALCILDDPQAKREVETCFETIESASDMWDYVSPHFRDALAESGNDREAFEEMLQQFVSGTREFIYVENLWRLWLRFGAWEWASYARDNAGIELTTDQYGELRVFEWAASVLMFGILEFALAMHDLHAECDACAGGSK